MSGTRGRKIAFFFTGRNSSKEKENKMLNYVQYYKNTKEGKRENKIQKQKISAVHFITIILVIVISSK